MTIQLKAKFAPRMPALFYDGTAAPSAKSWQGFTIPQPGLPIHYYSGASSAVPTALMRVPNFIDSLSDFSTGALPNTYLLKYNLFFGGCGGHLDGNRFGVLVPAYPSGTASFSITIPKEDSPGVYTGATQSQSVSFQTYSYPTGQLVGSKALLIAQSGRSIYSAFDWAWDGTSRYVPTPKVFSQFDDDLALFTAIRGELQSAMVVGLTHYHENSVSNDIYGQNPGPWPVDSAVYAAAIALANSNEKAKIASMSDVYADLGPSGNVTAYVDSNIQTWANSIFGT